MKTFDIYENSLTSEVIAIEKGWSWLAFFFTLIYAVFKGNWTFLKFAIIGQIILYFCFKILFALTLNLFNFPCIVAE